MLDNLVLLTNCYIHKCNEELKKRKEIRTKWFKDTNKIHQDYKNKLITQKQLISKLEILDNKYFNSIENISERKCEINKCYTLVKKHLDYLSERNNINKKDNYNINDYIKILKINNKNNLKTIPNYP